MAKRSAGRASRGGNALPMPSSREMRKYQAESDLHTLQRAQEIMSSKPRMAAARRLAEATVKAVKKV